MREREREREREICVVGKGIVLFDSRRCCYGCKYEIYIYFL